MNDKINENGYSLRCELARYRLLQKIASLSSSMRHYRLFTKRRGQPAVLDGAVFAFCTKMRNQVRLLLWDRGGYWLLTRKVYRGTFIWPESSSDQECIAGCYRQLRVLLQDTRSRKQAVFQVCEELEKIRLKMIVNNSTVYT